MVNYKNDAANASFRCAPTLCWDCARASGGGNCDWADALKPIPDWVTESLSTSVSHSVLYCPKFVRGRCSSELTDEQLEDNYTNDVGVVGSNNTICRPGVSTSKVSGYRYTCPMCNTVFGFKTSKCPMCGVNLLWHSFV